MSGDPLFAASSAKFHSGTGWPSFVESVELDNVVERPDRSHGMRRTEVRARDGDSHLGVLATVCIRVSNGSDHECLCGPLVIMMKPAEDRDWEDLSADRGD